MWNIRTGAYMSNEAIDTYLRAVPEPTRSALAELCRIIEASDERVRGEIKWNAPSYAIDDHFATTGVERSGGVRLVLHTGARRVGAPREVVVDDLAGLLDWKSVDRAVAVFASADDVREHEAALHTIISGWIGETQFATPR